MSRRLIVIFLFALLCIATIVYVSNNTEKKPEFSLLSVVPERQIVGHLDLRNLLEDSKTINRHLKWGISFNLYLTQVEKQLLNSGLKLESTYFTYSDSLNETALYLEIENKEKFNKFIIDFLETYNFKLIDSKSKIYRIDEQKTSMILNEHHLAFYRGDIDFDRIKGAQNPFRDSLMSLKNTLFLNPQGLDTIYKDEYCQATYSLDSTLSINGSWFVEKGHPIEKIQDSMFVYPSALKNWFFALNLNPKAFESYQNEWLQEKFNWMTKKSNFNHKEFREYWDGTMSLQFGGETVIEKVTTKTVFDENFNQIEEKKITRTNIKDFGLVVGSSKPDKMLSLIKKQANVKTKDSEIYFPFSPPLKPILMRNALLLRSGGKDLIKFDSDEVITLQGELMKLFIEIHGVNTSPRRFDFQVEIEKSTNTNS